MSDTDMGRGRDPLEVAVNMGFWRYRWLKFAGVSWPWGPFVRSGNRSTAQKPAQCEARTGAHPFARMAAVDGHELVLARGEDAFAALQTALERLGQSPASRA